MRLALIDGFSHIRRRPLQLKTSSCAQSLHPDAARTVSSRGLKDGHCQRPCEDGQQLCKHEGHKFEVEFSETRGRVRFPSALATMEASADALLFSIETDDTESVERLKEIVANHLDRFAFREAPLPFKWSAAEDR
jgi:uncharacterized protein